MTTPTSATTQTPISLESPDASEILGTASSAISQKTRQVTRDHFERLYRDRDDVALCENFLPECPHPNDPNFLRAWEELDFALSYFVQKAIEEALTLTDFKTQDLFYRVHSLFSSLQYNVEMFSPDSPNTNLLPLDEIRSRSLRSFTNEQINRLQQLVTNAQNTLISQQSKLIDAEKRIQELEAQLQKQKDPDNTN